MNNKKIIARVLFVSFLSILVGTTVLAENNTVVEERRQSMEIPRSSPEEIQKMDLAIERYLKGVETPADIRFLKEQSMINHLNELRVFSAEEAKKKEARQKELLKKKEGDVIEIDKGGKVSVKAAIVKNNDINLMGKREVAQQGYYIWIIAIFTIINFIGMIFLFLRKKK